MASKENHIWMIQEKTPKVIEALETIELVEGERMKTTKVRMNLDPLTKEKSISFFKKKTWMCSHGAMRIGLAYQQVSFGIT